MAVSNRNASFVFCVECDKLGILIRRCCLKGIPYGIALILTFFNMRV